MFDVALCRAGTLVKTRSLSFVEKIKLSINAHENVVWINHKSVHFVATRKQNFVAEVARESQDGSNPCRGTRQRLGVFQHWASLNGCPHCVQKLHGMVAGAFVQKPPKMSLMVKSVFIVVAEP